jgi:hypothetical protein
MRIPTNSNFSKEIAKKFKQIFHRDMTFGGLQDLQDEINMINPVDSYLANQVIKLEKDHAKQIFKLQEQYDKNTQKEKVLLEKLVKLKEKNKRLAWHLHQVKYHQPTL